MVEEQMNRMYEVEVQSVGADKKAFFTFQAENMPLARDHARTLERDKADYGWKFVSTQPEFVGWA